LHEIEVEAMPAAILFAFVTGILYAANTSPLALYNRTEYAAAVALLNQSNPDAGNLELLGQCWLMLGDFKKATDVLERAAAMDPGDSTIQTWLGRAWGRRAETSFALLAAGYATKSRQAFEKALQLNAANTDALGDLSDFYIDAPSLVGGGLEKAASLLPQFARYDPVGGYLAQARIAEKKKQFADAEADLRRAIEMGPGKVGLVLNLAQFLSRRGRYEESEKAFAQAEHVAENATPDSPRILYARADSYISARRNMDQARDLLKKYLAATNLTPDDPPRWQAQNLLRKAGGA
jgi:tetratricopeptide (TPR) repeat protein